MPRCTKLPGVLVLLTLASAATAQTAWGPDDNGMYISGDTGRRFNNPMSAVIDGAIQRQQNLNMVFQQMMMQEMIDEEFRKIGRKIIAQGKASAAVPPINENTVGVLLPDLSDRERSQTIADFQQQWQRYVAYAQSRGSDPTDVAEVTALALMVGYEQAHGAKTTAAQRKGVAKDIRANLLADPLYQGKGVAAAAQTALKWGTSTLATAEAKGDDAKQAGEALAGALWPDPVEAMEPTATGFIDRGRRIVAASEGTAAFRRVLSDEASARETIPPVQPVSQSIRDMFGEERAKEMDKEHAEQREAQIADRAAALARFRKQLAATELSDADMADVGTAVAGWLWPIAREGERPSPRQLQYFRALLRKDIGADPAIQRMSDEQRQLMADGYAVRAVAVLEQWKQGDEIEAGAKADAQNDDAMMRLLAMSRQQSADSTRGAASSAAVVVLTNLFSPREFAKMRLEGDALVVE